jgi:hypothetical protein
VGWLSCPAFYLRKQQIVFATLLHSLKALATAVYMS